MRPRLRGDEHAEEACGLGQGSGRRGQDTIPVGGSETPAAGSMLSVHLTAQLEKRDKLWHHLESRPEDERAILRLARIQAEMGQAADFATLARSLCRRDRRAWRGCCRALHGRLGLAREAASLLLEVHEAEPENSEVCCYLARLQPSQASHWYEQALRANPCCVAALVAMADAHRKAEQFDEAVRLYRAAHHWRPLGPRSLYRLGEALVRGGHRAEGRDYLLQVLRDGDGACHVHAAITVALSHVLDQQHEQALEYCRRAEELHARLPQGGIQELKLARTLKGVVQLRSGRAAEAAETLRSVSLRAGGGEAAGGDPAQWCWDEVIQSSLGLAETLRGDFAAAERHLELARRLAGPCPSADVLVASARLRQAQGDLEAAHGLLLRALAADRNAPLALLHMGHLLLCQKQLDRAIQYLQKCQQQPLGTLAYGTAQKGTAHLYLCVAHHWRRADGRGEGDPVAQEHFRSAYSLQPDLRRALAAPGPYASGAGARRYAAGPGLEEAGACLVTGNPPRMGIIDLSAEQATVLLFYAEACGLAPAGAPRAAATPRHTVVHDEPVFSKAPLAPSPSGCAVPTLVGTSSTAAPSSPGPSRDSSEPALLLVGSGTQASCGAGGQGDVSAAGEATGLSDAATALALSGRLPPEKVLHLSDMELGECISRGEFAVVHRGLLRSSRREVVVKALHRRDCGCDGGAAELLAEICVIAELSHPRIVTFVGACLDPMHVALVTELAPGGNLHQALHVRQRRFGRGECLQLACELLEGVLYLHSQQPVIAHLDLKSMNLVLDAEGQHLQICDFGLARALGTFAEGPDVDPRERPPSRAGSPRYMAPECYDSSLGVITEKADVWSSGCVLMEIFGARLPYAECGNVQQILKAMLVHRCGPCIPVATEAPVRAIIAPMLAFEAWQRPAIAQVLPQLQQAFGGAGSVVPAGVGSAAVAGGDTSRFMWVSP